MITQQRLPNSLLAAWARAFIMHDRMTKEFGQPAVPIMLRNNGKDTVYLRAPSWKVATLWLRRGLINPKDKLWVEILRGLVIASVHIWGEFK